MSAPRRTRGIAAILILATAACGRLELGAEPGPATAPLDATSTGAPDVTDAGASLEPATGDGWIILSPTNVSEDRYHVRAWFRRETPPPRPNAIVVPADGCTLDVADDTVESEIYEADAYAGEMRARAGGRSVELEWVEPAKTYSTRNDLIVGPGVPVEIEGSGGDVPRFELTVHRTEPLRFLTRFEDGITKSAFPIVWTAPPTPSSVMVILSSERRRVLCSTDTTKAFFTIPDEFVRAVADYPGHDEEGHPALGLVVKVTDQHRVRVGSYDVRVSSNAEDFVTVLALH